MNIIVLGAGEIGLQLSKRLAQEKHNITIVEQDHAMATRSGEQLDALVVEGHAGSYRVLREAGIERADILAAMTNEDEVNLFACQIARRVGVATTIARVRNPELTDGTFILSPKELGADLIIHPEKETADAVVRLIRRSSATDVVEFAEGKVQLIGIRIGLDSPVLRIPLRDLGERMGNPPVRIVAINRRESTVIPRGDDILVPRDQIYVVCDPDYIPEYLDTLGIHDTRIENIMILGGGLIGQFVAQALGNEVHVKIIESNAARSQEIANILSHSLIIHGDGTDIDLLAAEGITDMDAFIAVTGDDENNIITTLIAHHLRVPRTIALVNKTEYLPITPTIGMDAVVSKQVLTVNAVMRFIRYQNVASITTLPGVDAEIIEIEVRPGSKITRRPLSGIRFPKHAIVGALLHDDRLVIPTGETRIEDGDRVVVFSLPRALNEVTKLFT
jgi:trk system potassium uptake protein TrkA